MMQVCTIVSAGRARRCPSSWRRSCARTRKVRRSRSSSAAMHECSRDSPPGTGCSRTERPGLAPGVEVQAGDRLASEPLLCCGSEGADRLERGQVQRQDLDTIGDGGGRGIACAEKDPSAGLSREPGEGLGADSGGATGHHDRLGQGGVPSVERKHLTRRGPPRPSCVQPLGSSPELLSTDERILTTDRNLHWRTRSTPSTRSCSSPSAA